MYSQYSRTHAKAFLNGLPLKQSFDNVHTSGCSRPPAGPGRTGQLWAHPAGQAQRLPVPFPPRPLEWQDPPKGVASHLEFTLWTQPWSPRQGRGTAWNRRPTVRSQLYATATGQDPLRARTAMDGAVWLTDTLQNIKHFSLLPADIQLFP